MAKSSFSRILPISLSLLLITVLAPVSANEKYFTVTEKSAIISGDGEGGAEIATFHAGSKRIFATNGAKNSIDIYDISEVSKPQKVGSVSLTSYGSDVTSVAAGRDVIAAAVLVTDSVELAQAVEAELKVRVAATKHADRIKSALSGVQSAIALVDDMKQGLDVVNAYAAEHLEIQTKNSRSDAEKIRNAGAVFIGRFSPVSLGDYSAGSNHVLPTGGCACHSSGLSVQTFLRGLHFIEYGQKAFTEIVDTVVTLANSEDLPAHGEAMTARLENLP